LQYVKKEKTINEINIESEMNEHESSENHINSEYKIVLRDALSQLDEEEQIIFLLKVLHNWTEEKIGTEFNLTRRQIQYKLNKIKQNLFNILLKKGITSSTDNTCKE